jgi:hypothetical protein
MHILLSLLAFVEGMTTDTIILLGRRSHMTSNVPKLHSSLAAYPLSVSLGITSLGSARGCLLDYLIMALFFIMPILDDY